MKNQVQLIGFISGDTEEGVTEQGKPFVKSAVTTTERYPDPDDASQRITEHMTHNIVVFGTLALKCQGLLKEGVQVILQGKLVHHPWTDKEGIKRVITHVQVLDIMVLFVPKS